MATEIERRFLVKSDNFWKLANFVRHIKQGYLGQLGDLTVRIRKVEWTEGVESCLTFKGPKVGGVGLEIETPMTDGVDELLARCGTQVIEKDRHYVYFQKLWEVDVFHGRHEGLVIAEVELKDINEPVMIPDWVGQEITGDDSYSNYALACR